MQNNQLKKAAFLSTMLTSLFAAEMALAQSQPIETLDDVDLSESMAEEDTIIVTGSRLRRDSFSSISPVQTIDAAQSRNFGLFDTSDIVSQSTQVTGAQLDGSINSGSPTAAVEGVPVNGPGAATIALRGLGAERTLLMVNGRRLAPSGVRGAPVAPDLNLIPSLMIDRIEILTDGSSSIYGADAVAGVANILLRNNFEGLETSANFSIPESSGGETYQLGFIGGAASDKGRFTVSAEWFNRNSVLTGDRSEFNDCLRDIDVTQSGNVVSACIDARPDNAVFIGSQGFVFSTPGSTDIGVPGFSTGDALPTEFRLTDTYTLQDEERATQLREELQRVNMLATGEYDLDFFSRDKFYFEASYAQRRSEGKFTQEQIFPGVSAFIPREDVNGNLLVNPDGSLQLFDNPLNPFSEDALPVISTTALPQRRDTELSNFRFVGGLEGDLAFGALEEKNWVYDVNYSYDRSYGTVVQPILRENAIRESLDTLRFDSNGNLTCGYPRTALSFGFLTPQDCVVVDFFADSLFTVNGGTKNFASSEEYNFIAGNAINTTEIEQSLFQGIVTGDLFDLPAGTVGLVLGAEHRKQSIASRNDVTRQNGLGASEVPDQEGDTIGSTSLTELFAETEIPVFEGFSANLSGRYTDEENFGDEFTYSIKGSWEVTDFFRLRSTFGTTFRAPNLREQFLAGQAGTIAGGNDPCLVPTIANNGGVYDPSADLRDPVLLANCVQDGVDPTALGLQATTGIPTTTGGSTGLIAETSESLTLGFVFSQPWSDDFDFDFSLTYFDINVSDTVEESSAADILARCYNDEPNLASAFCDRISRNTGNPTTATISNVDASFINVGKVTAEGIDFNARLMTGLDKWWSGADLALNLTGTYTLSQTEQIDPDSPVDDNVGEISNPELAFITTAAVSKNNWSGRWRTRYIGEGQQDDSDAFAVVTNNTSACGVLGITEACRDVDFVGDSWIHDVSVSYNADDWSLTAGVNNLFSSKPPLIDQGEGPSRLNIVTSSGYDLVGRRFFVNASKRF
jgi:iron complex outermembrane receptor protein